VEKTLYTTAEAFPTILKRSEIISVGTISLSPLQTAIERTARKTLELAGLEKKITDGDDTTFNILTQELMYAVDTNIEGCVANYHDLLPNPRHSMEEDEDEDTLINPPNPLENALRVSLVDYALVVRRCLSLYTRPAQQATKSDLSLRKYLSSLQIILANLVYRIRVFLRNRAGNLGAACRAAPNTITHRLMARRSYVAIPGGKSDPRRPATQRPQS
jgi:hypothetical protein